ncbi:MAG: hypothetical protein RLZZ36_1506, partial [Pseudomonadota bacterium]
MWDERSILGFDLRSAGLAGAKLTLLGALCAALVACSP